jgi:hypothetical protein
MVDTCVITRTATSVVDLDTGVITGTTTTVYSGKCRLKLPVAVARPSLVGQAQDFLQHPILSLPATTTGVQINDVLTITASLLMPSLVGRIFHVRAIPGQSHMTAARFEVMEVMA